MQQDNEIVEGDEMSRLDVFTQHELVRNQGMFAQPFAYQEVDRMRIQFFISQVVRLNGAQRPNEELFGMRESRNRFESDILYFNAKVAMVNSSKDSYQALKGYTMKELLSTELWNLLMYRNTKDPIVPHLDFYEYGENDGFHVSVTVLYTLILAFISSLHAVFGRLDVQVQRDYDKRRATVRAVQDQEFSFLLDNAFCTARDNLESCSSCRQAYNTIQDYPLYQVLDVSFSAQLHSSHTLLVRNDGPPALLVTKNVYAHNDFSEVGRSSLLVVLTSKELALVYSYLLFLRKSMLYLTLVKQFSSVETMLSFPLRQIREEIMYLCGQSLPSSADHAIVLNLYDFEELLLGADSCNLNQYIQSFRFSVLLDLVQREVEQRQHQ